MLRRAARKHHSSRTRRRADPNVNRRLCGAGAGAVESTPTQTAALESQNCQIGAQGHQSTRGAARRPRLSLSLLLNARGTTATTSSSPPRCSTPPPAAATPATELEQKQARAPRAQSAVGRSREPNRMGKRARSIEKWIDRPHAQRQSAPPANCRSLLPSRQPAPPQNDERARSAPLRTRALG